MQIRHKRKAAAQNKTSSCCLLPSPENPQLTDCPGSASIRRRTKPASATIMPAGREARKSRTGERSRHLGDGSAAPIVYLKSVVFSGHSVGQGLHTPRMESRMRLCGDIPADRVFAQPFDCRLPKSIQAGSLSHGIEREHSMAERKAAPVHFLFMIKAFASDCTLRNQD